MWMLARRMLLHDRIRFFVAGAGVSVSVLLVLVQVGLYYGFMQNASTIIDNSRATIWLTGEGTESFDSASPIDERVYYQAAATPGVKRAERMVFSFGRFKRPEGGHQLVQVIGLERGATLVQPWNVVSGDASRIRERDGIVIDQSETKKLKTYALGDRREIGRVRSQVVGFTEGIRSFTYSPFVFTNIKAARKYTHVAPDKVTYVLIEPEPGTDLAALQARLNRIPYVTAYFAPTFARMAQDFWSKRTGVGVGFFMTALMGVIVGTVIVGQILYNGALEHLKEYGTLKAMGAKNGAIALAILYQALAYAVVGLACGGALTLVVRELFDRANLNVLLFGELLAATATLTVAMCVGSSMLAVLKMLQVDPAMVFKG
jgi:putative ABC transport system permease protein